MNLPPHMVKSVTLCCVRNGTKLDRCLALINKRVKLNENIITNTVVNVRSGLPRIINLIPNKVPSLLVFNI